MQTVVDTWLGGGEVLATVHVPFVGSDTGVVLCAPLGQDYTIAYRTMRHLADRIALGEPGSGGLAAIRYDHPGFGDSTAALTPESLLHGARLAADALRGAGCKQIVYLGLGSGALVASAAAEADENTAGLVLWDPAASGRLWLRRQKSLYALAVGKDAEPTPEGVVEIAGAEFSEAFATYFAGLDYSPALVERAKVLVAVRKGASKTPPKALRPVADSLDIIEISGHEETLDTSSVLATIPAESVRQVSEWVIQNFGGSHTLFSGPIPVEEALVTEDGVELSETLTRFGDNHLFGIETRPVGADSSIPGVVLHNGSAEHRIGTTRHQVLLARKLASQGMRVLRFDRRGTGESGDVVPGEASLLYSQAWVDDGEAALAYLGLPREKLGVVGMCVGGWIGLIAEPKNTRFVVALSPDDHRIRIEKPGAEIANLVPVSDAVTPSLIQAALYHTVAFAKKHLPYRVLVALARRGRLRFAEPNLRRPLEAGTDVLLYLGPEDREIFDAHGGRIAETRLTNLPGRLTVFNRETGDHALYSPGIRNEAIDWSVEQAILEFGLTPEHAGSHAPSGSSSR